MKTFYLIDTSSLFFRAFYAIPHMNNDEGLPTNAVYGFLSMMIKILKEKKPDYIALCMDRKEPSFRKDLYEEYKANRTEMPEDLAQQMPLINELIDLLGLQKVSIKGFEADDLIGTLAIKGSKEKVKSIIVSGDKDFAQLISDDVVMYDTMKEITYDSKGVKEKWGVTPEQFIDYLAIVGDSSDNIPGIKGIGPKGAIKLLNEYSNLEQILKSVDQIKAPALKKKISENTEMAKLSKILVKIKTDVKINHSLSDFKPSEFDEEKLKEFLRNLNFKSFERKLFDDKDISKKTEISKDKNKTKNNDKPKKSSSTVDLWRLEEASENIEPYSEIFCFEHQDQVFFNIKKKTFQIEGEIIEIGECLDSKKLKWSGFDVKSIWRKLGLKKYHEVLWDSMMAAYIINPSNIKSFETEYEKHMVNKIDSELSEMDLLKSHQDFNKKVYEELKNLNGLEVFENIEMPLIPVLYEMEKNGILLDDQILKLQSLELEKDLLSLEKKIHQLSGEEFNILSPKQLGEILFQKLGLPVIKKTKTGYSTDSSVLEKLSKEHDICKEILEFRELSKLKSTYVDSLPKLINPKTHRIHSELKQAVTTTGRLSSANPNLQNIPIRTERGRKIRSAFKAQKGFQLLSVDYSQIELRILAHYSNDQNMIDAFKSDFDIHQATAAEIFSTPLEEVTSEQRRQAKAVNFGIAYGQGAFGLADSLNISRKEGKAIIDQYFQKFSGIKTYMDEIIKQAYEQGFVETLWGRRRYIKEMKSTNKMIQKFGERAAINAPIQGSASDIVKKAMIEIFDSVDAKMLLQVHDELLFEVPSEDINDISLEVKDIMENIVELSVPLRVNIAWGENWEDAHA